ncbi:hypothetical protein AB5I41_23605 [Sphingomonas sp. MMS24-JH45]
MGFQRDHHDGAGGRLAYDLRGNLTQVTDANGRRTVTYYDRLDRKFGEVDATGAYTTYTYTANNVVASRRYATRLNPTNVSRTTRPHADRERRARSGGRSPATHSAAPGRQRGERAGGTVERVGVRHRHPGRDGERKL